MIASSLLKTISPEMGHFVQRPLGMSFFLTTTVEYLGLLKSDMEAAED
jgi:hypothetical protein